MAWAQPNVLGIDTATADVAVAVCADGEPLSERRAPPPQSGRPRHSEALLAEIEAAVAEAGGWERVGLIAVGIGPGTFTGLRVGVATARALGQARGLELAPVSSLAALARGIGGGEERERLALIDARRGELFAGLYGSAEEPIWEPFVAGPDELGERVATAAPRRWRPATARYDSENGYRPRASRSCPTQTRHIGWRRDTSACSPTGRRGRGPST